MAGPDPRDEVDGLRTQLRGTGDDQRHVQFDADCDDLLKMSDNSRLVPSEIGDHRHLKLLRHPSRLAALAPPPTVADFADNDETEMADGTDNDDVADLGEEHGLLGVALEYRAAAEAIVRWVNDEDATEHTNQDYRTALRSVGRYRLQRDDPPTTPGGLMWIVPKTGWALQAFVTRHNLLIFVD
jgi:hypothetical protein